MKTKNGKVVGGRSGEHEVLRLRSSIAENIDRDNMIYTL